MALEPKVEINLSTLDNMQLVLQSNQHLDSNINNTAQNYHTIDVSLAMTNLANVGNVLKLAYAGSKGFRCSVNTIEILSKYQGMIKNSFIATSSFVSACLTALNLHKMALMMAEKGKLDSALKMLEKCSELANKMAVESGKLVEEASSLCDLSSKALITAQSDENVSKEEKEKITKIINETKAKQAELERKTKDLYQRIEEAKAEQAEIAKKADSERQKEFCLKLISTIIPVSKVVECVSKTGSIDGNKVAEASASTKLDEKEMLIMKMKNELQKEEREANGEIAKIGVLLKGLKLNDKDLQASIYSLELAVKALGKIKTTFEHTRQFWLGVEKHCKKLSDIDILKTLNSDPDFKGEFISELKTSAVGWLTLGKINYTAQLSIKNVDRETDKILENLPTGSEALTIVQSGADMIISSLQNETSALM